MNLNFIQVADSALPNEPSLPEPLVGLRLSVTYSTYVTTTINATVETDGLQYSTVHNYQDPTERQTQNIYIHTQIQPICPKDGRTATLHSNTGDAPIADLACTTD